MNEEILLEWTDRTLASFCREFAPVSEKKCLILDNLKCQTGESFDEKLKELNFERRLLPANCTDLVQPIDRHFAQDLKERIRSHLNEKLGNDYGFLKQWLGLREGSFPA